MPSIGRVSLAIFTADHENRPSEQDVRFNLELQATRRVVLRHTNKMPLWMSTTVLLVGSDSMFRSPSFVRLWSSPMTFFRRLAVQFCLSGDQHAWSDQAAKARYAAISPFLALNHFPFSPYGDTLTCADLIVLSHQTLIRTSHCMMRRSFPRNLVSFLSLALHHIGIASQISLIRSREKKLRMEENAMACSNQRFV